LREKRHKNIGMVENTVLSLSYGNLVIKPPEKLHGLVPESFETYQIVDPGNIIIRPTDLQNDWTSLRVGLSKYRGIITSAYICLNAFGELIPEYAYLLLHTYDLLKVFYGMGSGLRQNLDFADLKRMPVLIPSLNEQRAIVAFLDAKLADIVHFIAEKERLIKLLQEQKTALINQAVTRGLNPQVGMKDSGIEALGDIPEHWEVRRNKSIFREVKDRSATGEETRLSMSQKYGLVESDSLESKTLQSESSEGFKVCQVNDLVLNRLKAHLGVFARSTIPGSVSPDYTVLRLKIDADVRYFEYLFRHPAYIGWFNKVVRGIIAGFWRLYTQDFYSIAAIFPPANEQRQIVEYILTETDKIKLSIESTEREITLMKEYRTALIAEAVTGKIDVRS
jgi:type I restriction enzyme S subunit